MDHTYSDLFGDHVKQLSVNASGQASGLCPLHDDKKPSFSMNLDTGLWKCHGCNKSGNAFQFAELIEIDPTPYKSYKTSGKSHNQPEIETRAKQFNEYLKTNFDSLKNLGKIPTPWTLEAVKDTFTGFDEANDRLVFNHCNLSGQPINIQWHKGKQEGQSESKLFPLNLIPNYNKDSFLVFCEGCKDSVTLLSHGINTVTNTTGAGSIPKDLTPLRDFRKIYIVYDSDEPGINGSQSLATKLKYEFPVMDVHIVFWKNKPSGYDVTDYFQEGNTTADFYKLLLNSETFKISNGNYYKTYRNDKETKLLKNAFLWQLWSFCRKEAAYKKKSVIWKTGRGSITISLERGQFVFGRNQLAKELNVKSSTLVYRLKRLQQMGNIEIKADNQYSIITICNYETSQ